MSVLPSFISLSSNWDVSTVVTWSSVAGLIAHVVFHAYEPNIIFVLLSSFTSISGLFVSMLFIAKHSLLNSLFLTSLISSTFTFTLCLSIACYRVFFSPLRNFPGPRWAAVSKFWYLSHSMHGGVQHVLESLHQRYGDIIRIGPNELCIRSLDAIEPILGSKVKMAKGPWFDGSFADRGGKSVHALKTYGPHAERRRYWDMAMTKTATNQYLVFVKDCADRLCERLRNECAAERMQDLRRVMNHLIFDIMGEVGFAHSFGMVDNGRDHTYVHFLEKAMRSLAIVSEIPWIIPILSYLPLGKDQAEIKDISMNATLERLKQGSSRHDMFTYFVQENGELYPDMTIKDLDAEVRSMIIAGSDTSATVLTFIFEFLSQHPEWAKRLREEVDSCYRGSGDFNLDEMPVLDAILNETLRVRPVVPGRSQRIVPPGGLVICDQYIPGGTYVGVPQRLIMRDERYFSPHPDVWRPERWLDPSTETTFRRSAFFPFSFGPFNCSGKNLGLLMIRYLLARFMSEFEITAAKNHDPVAFERGIKEWFTVQKGPFWVEIRPRD